MKSFTEIIEKCRDKNYLSQNKCFIKEYLKQRKSIDCLKNELNGKKNYLVLNILEKIDYDFNLVIPSFDKKYITHYMYASIFWMYKKAYIDKNKLENIQEDFKIMKNYNKMFEDTENHFLLFKIENDRKLQKIIKEDYNIKNTISINITPNYLGEYLFVLNVDSLFDLSEYNDYDIEDAREIISRIKHDFTKLSIQEEGELYNINKIRNKYHYSTMLYNKVDRILNNKFSKVYSNILQAKRKGIECKLVTECSVHQLLAEITFFKYENISYDDLYSVKDKENTYKKIFKDYEDRRIVVFGEDCSVEYDKKIWYLDMKYFNIFNKQNI